MVDMKDMKDKTEQTDRIADDYNKAHCDFDVDMELLCTLTKHDAPYHHAVVDLCYQLDLGTANNATGAIERLRKMGLSIKTGNQNPRRLEPDKPKAKKKKKGAFTELGKGKRCVYIGDDSSWAKAQRLGGDYWDRVYGDLALANKEIAELVPVRRAGRTLEELATIQESRREGVGK